MPTGPTTFTVAHPERWWRVMRSEVDLTRDQRWAGTPSLQWERIAYAVEELGRDLVFGACEMDEAGSAILELHRPLEEPELRIVKTWLTSASPPALHPWEREPSNGRHRLLGAWDAAPDLLLPVRSFFLDSIEEGPSLAHRRYLDELEDLIPQIPKCIRERNNIALAALQHAKVNTLRQLPTSL